MQQTEKYKLNLIEKDDPFSPDRLNENTQKLEERLAAETAARAESVSDLQRRVTAIEVRKFFTGSYTGDGKDYREVHLGVTPMLVLIDGPYELMEIAVLAPGEIQANFGVLEGGFWTKGSKCNSNGTTYNYFVLV